MKKLPKRGTSAITGSLTKKYIFLFLLLLLIAGTGFSQSIYSKKFLEQSSMEELNAYLNASKKKKQTGTIMSVAGPVTLLAGGIIFNEHWNKSGDVSYTKTDIGGWMIVAGFVSTIVGVPMLITGSTRVKRITGVMDAKSVSFEIAPCRFFNSPAQSTQAGIAFSVRF